MNEKSHDNEIIFIRIFWKKRQEINLKKKIGKIINQRPTSNIQIRLLFLKKKTKKNPREILFKNKTFETIFFFQETHIIN